MNNMPTKPGFYMVVRNNAIEQCEPTVAWLTEGKSIYFVGSGMPHIPPYAELADCIEWTRIPDNDTLKAMRELAKRNPFVRIDWDGGSLLRCFFCTGTSGSHTPGCPWLRAQEKD